MATPREILFNAFAMNTVGHLSPGQWTIPRDRSRDYNRLGTWTDLARTLERGLFDGLFIADVIGIYDVYGEGPEAALRSAAQMPINDPMMLVSAMAAVTRHLGFGITANLTWTSPYLLARAFSTLDHLTDGRIGWNIVTGYLDSGARAHGLPGLIAHDERYARAEEYMQVCYKLWEGSWADDAAIRDAATGRFADPARIRPVRHAGPFYTVDGIHLCEPSPQRTPLLYQAGSSAAGRAFAGAHAECVFVSGPSAPVIRRRTAELREAVAAAGRDPADLKVFALLTVVVAETQAEAEDRHAEYLRHASPEGALALMAGWTGLDLSGYALDQEIRHIEREGYRTALENITRADPDRVWTVRDIAARCAIGGIGPVVVGDARQAADAVEAWVAETDTDGLNLAYAVMPETFEAIADHLVPELQRRERFKRGYRPGSLRAKLYGRDRLAPPHPAATHRFA
jgi:FMN-dependent oxidoreductase (nitrilotriacetate monooxygenase family)